MVTKKKIVITHKFCIFFFHMQIICVNTISMKVTCAHSFLSVLAISLTWVHSAEQPEEATISSEILDQVVVTANRSDQTLYEQILPANVL